MKKDLLRCRDTLVSTGTGICIFGLWSVIRVIMAAILDGQGVKDVIGEYIESMYVFLITCAVLAIVLLLIVAIHLYIGISARKVGLGGKKRTAYIIIAVLYTLFYIYVSASEILRFNIMEGSFLDFLVSRLVDVTVIATLISMIIASIKEKYLVRRIKEQEKL